MRVFISIIFVFILTGCAVAVLPDNPLKTAKVGDWIELKLVTDQDGQLNIQTFRHKIVKKDDKSVTLRSEDVFQGKNMGVTENQIALDKPYCFFPMDSIGTLSEGDSIITLMRKPFNCHWMRRQVSFDIKGQTITKTTTTWSCPEVPLSQIIKIVSEQNDGMKKTITTQEVVGFGNE